MRKWKRTEKFIENCGLRLYYDYIIEYKDRYILKKGGVATATLEKGREEIF